MRIRFLVLFLLAMAATATAGDLYQASVTSAGDANLLTRVGAEPVYRLHDGYLIITDAATAESLRISGMNLSLVETDVGLERLAIDRRRDGLNVSKYDLLYEEGDLRIFLLPSSTEAYRSREGSELIPIDNSNLEFTYNAPVMLDRSTLLAGVDLWDLIGSVSQDSIDAWLHRLQAFGDRLAGTDSSHAASQWIKEKFESFGYDSVEFQDFTGLQVWDYTPVPCRNVVATKIGTRYPDIQIVVGAHFDAVPYSPGADDNGSGTVGVLEIARVLAAVETDVTVIFVAFDSEESHIVGSQYYVDSAIAAADDILMMFNMDMIGDYMNDAEAAMYYGPERAYSELWAYLADSLVGISGMLLGQAGGSDHVPFNQAGFDIVCLSEYNFSEVYHTVNDSTTYISFDYLTRMIQASAATVYTISRSLPPVQTTAAYDVGDGQSVQVEWEPGDLTRLDHYELHYERQSTEETWYIDVDADSTIYVVSGLVEGEEYTFHLLGVDSTGAKSIKFNQVTCVPNLLPALPENLVALPEINSIRLSWIGNNAELDFSHYIVIRDNVRLPDPLSDTFYIDNDPALGSVLHDYFVVAVDNDGYISDTTGVSPATTRAATLDAGRILAINRTGIPTTLADSAITREFMMEALEGLDIDFLSDPAPHSSQGLTTLEHLVGYEMVVIGAESGKGFDDIGGIFGILPALTYYQSLGGKVVAFGRWGDVTISPSAADTLHYGEDMYNYYYDGTFYVEGRIRPLTSLVLTDLTLKTDFIGGHSLTAEYPPLPWDSLAAALHTSRGITFKVKDGVPCPSIPLLSGDQYDVIYSYDSNTDSSFTEGEPVGWRSLDGPGGFVFMDIPLSFMQREPAVYALRQAIGDLGIDVGNDYDGDGVANEVDNCRFVGNVDQTDSDGDGFGDACDLCMGSNDSVDTDGDFVPDGCDVCPGFGDAVDRDADGVPDGCDVCPGYDDFADEDGDAVPDDCDICPGYDDLSDFDLDAVPDSCDNCPEVPNSDQSDFNGDSVGDACDNCCGWFTGNFTGNCNCSEDGKMTLADISRLIDRIYISKSALCCELNGNVNGSEDGLMTLSDITALIDHVFVSKEPTAECQ